MTIKSGDGRLTVSRRPDGVICVKAHSVDIQQVYDALLPLLPPPAPTARDVAEALLRATTASATAVWDRSVLDLARRWDEGGRP